MFSKFTQKTPRALTRVFKQFFDLHEYQSKDLMRKFKIRVQKGSIALNPETAYEVATKLDPSGGLILKAQVHAGGRGKGIEVKPILKINFFYSGHLTSGLKGGVKICKTPEEVRNYTKQMIGYNLITHQTVKEGQFIVL
jgi:succinyl-CoA synthetase beta subunit